MSRVTGQKESGQKGSGQIESGQKGSGQEESGHPEPGSGRNGNGIQSVDRAFAILELLARNGRSGVTEIAHELRVHKSTAFRLLAALESHGMVEQSVSRGKYQVGVGALRLAGAVASRLSLVTQARPTLERLADDLGETVNLAVHRSGYAVNLDQAMGGSALTSFDWIGNLTPMHATASGKVLLAALAPADRAEVLKTRPLRRYTAATIVRRPDLEADLGRVTDRGLASAEGELEEGLNAIAVPVCDHSGQVVAAISVSGPAFRFNPSDVEVEAAVRVAGAEVSRLLGYAVPR